MSEIIELDLTDDLATVESIIHTFKRSTSPKNREGKNDEYTLKGLKINRFDWNDDNTPKEIHFTSKNMKYDIVITEHIE